MTPNCGAIVASIRVSDVCLTVGRKAGSVHKHGACRYSYKRCDNDKLAFTVALLNTPRALETNVILPRSSRLSAVSGHYFIVSQ